MSGFFARNETDVEDLAADRLERFPVLRLYRPSVLEEVGFQIVPTFRTPHVTLAFGGDLDLWIDKLRTAEHVERTNPYHESD